MWRIFFGENTCVVEDPASCSGDEEKGFRTIMVGDPTEGIKDKCLGESCKTFPGAKRKQKLKNSQMYLL